MTIERFMVEGQLPPVSHYCHAVRAGPPIWVSGVVGATCSRCKRLQSHSLAAWPSAEISFMDPNVGVNVVHGGRLAEADDADALRQTMIEEWSSETGPEGAAGGMEIDDIIDPAETRLWLCNRLQRLHVAPPTPETQICGPARTAWQ